jgi:hypothetical protein
LKFSAESNYPEGCESPLKISPQACAYNAHHSENEKAIPFFTSWRCRKKLITNLENIAIGSVKFFKNQIIIFINWQRCNESSIVLEPAFLRALSSLLALAVHKMFLLSLQCSEFFVLCWQLKIIKIFPMTLL